MAGRAEHQATLRAQAVVQTLFGGTHGICDVAGCNCSSVRSATEIADPGVRGDSAGYAETLQYLLARADNLAQKRAAIAGNAGASGHVIVDILTRRGRTGAMLFKPGDVYFDVYAVAVSKNAVDFAAHPSLGGARKRFSGTSSALGAILAGSEHHADIGAVAAFAIPGMTGCTVYGTGNPRAVGRSAGASIQSSPTLLHCNRTGGKSRTVINNIAIDEVPDGIRY